MSREKETLILRGLLPKPDAGSKKELEGNGFGIRFSQGWRTPKNGF